MADHFQRPGWFTQHVFNPMVALLTRLGLPLAGSRVLEVRGRKTGEPHHTPVNPLSLDGARYLVAPRGHTNWVRNLRAGDGRAVLQRRRREDVALVEDVSDRRPAILRRYLELAPGARPFFPIDRRASLSDFGRIVDQYPVFRVD